MFFFGLAALVVGTAAGELRKVMETIRVPGSHESVQLGVAEQYITKFGELAKTTNALVLPALVSDVGSIIAVAMNALRQIGPVTTTKT
jgi:hypothetical protein